MYSLAQLSLLVLVSHGVSKKPERKFPKDFLFGVSTAAYQIEGGWDADDKGESIWDNLTHSQPWRIKDLSNGDITTDSYRNYLRDVKMLRQLGVNVYRFSVSWTRILPNGEVDYISDAGIRYYNKLINELLKYNIKPFITIYHWDLPQTLLEYGGFLHPKFPKWFQEYACVLFDKFGDRVKHFITFSEPHVICNKKAYQDSLMTEIIESHDEFTYLCTQRLLIAHARAYRAYESHFKNEQQGEVGIAISVNSLEPKTQNEDDVQGAELFRLREWGIFADPIFSTTGDWPEEIREANRKLRERKNDAPRIPDFTTRQRSLVRGACDFFGVNHYTGRLFSATDGISVPPEWPVSNSSWLVLAPNSLLKALTELAARYQNPKFYVTETGWSSDMDLEDFDRITYYRSSLENVLDALEVGINLKGYMAWTLMDSFEWFQGYSERFGLYHVDFKDPIRPRTPRMSAFFYKDVIKNKVINYNSDIYWTSLYNGMVIDPDH